jgi:hypothetical protein
LVSVRIPVHREDEDGLNKKKKKSETVTVAAARVAPPAVVVAGIPTISNPSTSRKESAVGDAVPVQVQENKKKQKQAEEVDQGVSTNKRQEMMEDALLHVVFGDPNGEIYRKKGAPKP